MTGGMGDPLTPSGVPAPPYGAAPSYTGGPQQ